MSVGRTSAFWWARAGVTTLCSVALAMPLTARAAPAEPVAAEADEPDEADVAPAAPDSPELARAKDLYGRGKTAFETTDYATAVEMWTEAYGALPDSRTNAPIKAALIYNLATAQERAFGIDADLTHLKRAEVLMQSYADSIPALYGDGEEAAAEEAKINERLADVRDKIANVEAEQRAAAEAAAARGGEETTDDRVVDQPTPDPKAKIFIITGASLLGVGVAGLGVMAGGLALGNAADQDVPADLTERRDQFDRGRAGNTMAYVGGAAGGALVVAGAVLLALGIKRQRTGLAAASVRPMLGRRHAGLVLRGRF